LSRSGLGSGLVICISDGDQEILNFPSSALMLFNLELAIIALLVTMLFRDQSIRRTNIHHWL
jgi:hypothetical protein